MLSMCFSYAFYLVLVTTLGAGILPLYRIGVDRHTPFLQIKNITAQRGYLPKVTHLVSEQVRTQTLLLLMAKLSTTVHCTSKFFGEVKASAGWHQLSTALLPLKSTVNLGDPKIWLMERNTDKDLS